MVSGSNPDGRATRFWCFPYRTKLRQKHSGVQPELAWAQFTRSVAKRCFWAGSSAGRVSDF